MDDKFIEAGFEALNENRSAKMLLFDFVSRHKQGIPQDERVINFLHDAFCQILSNVPAEKALHLNDPKTGPKPVSFQRDYNIFDAVIRLKIKQKITFDKAFDKLASDGIPEYNYSTGKLEVTNYTRRVIQEAYYKLIKQFPEYKRLFKK